MLKKAVIGGSVLLSFLLPVPIFASYLHFSPNQINASQGDTFNIQIRLNTLQDNVNTVKVNISYPSDNLSVTGINYGNSAFGIDVENSTSNGLIKITRGSLKTINGDAIIGTITFQAQKASSSQLTFTPESKVPRLFDFADSLNFSQNGIATITVNSKSNLLGSNNASSCKSKENSIKVNSKQILNSGEDILLSIDQISQMIQNNTAKPILSQNQFLTSNIDLQKTEVQQNVLVAKNDLDAFNCDLPNAKAKLNQFKNDVAALKQSLKNYRQSVKDLIKVLSGK